jgi:hypothetical protein
MNTTKVSEIFIGDGTALDADTTSISAIAAQLNFVSGDMTVTTGSSITITTDPIIYAVNKLANGDLKRSFPIKGTNVTAYQGRSYVPATRSVAAIGYNRKTATGSFIVASSTLYNSTISFKNDKLLYAERPEVLRISFTSSASATQLTVATQYAGVINSSAYGTGPTKQVKAIVVGDGTGVYGVTGATNYGVEVWGLDINQFDATSYKENQVYFSVQLMTDSGFGLTSNTVISSVDPGVGTYNTVYNLEKFNYQFEGVLNRRLFPIPVLAYLSASAGVTSDTLAAFTVTGTSGEDKLTFSAAASTQLPVGSLIVVSSNTYEIKYWISTTVAILTTVLLTSPSTTDVAGKAWYDIININVDDYVVTPGANVTVGSKKHLTIATPAIATTSTAMTTAPTGTSDLTTLLNAYMVTTPGRFTSVSL